MSNEIKTRLTKIAFTLALAAAVALLLAYGGQWKLIHIDYPEEFPNDPGTDHGFRLLMLYWGTIGGWLAMLNAIFCMASLLLSVIAWLKVRTELRNRLWQAAVTMDVLMIGFWCWLIALTLGPGSVPRPSF